ncbi:MAG: GC-type dockerin domain-anchored protein [Planctomycetota bacterium]|nr:GC-type dockerin domain-anchored protein [Planctomycetota bacterium]
MLFSSTSGRGSSVLSFVGAGLMLASGASVSLAQVRVDVIAARGLAVPGLPGVTFGPLGNNTPPYFSDAGTLAFTATLTGSVTQSDNSALFYGSIDTLDVLVREGDAAFAPVDAEVFNEPSSFLNLNNSGTLVFQAPLRTRAGSVDSTNDGTLWRVGTTTDLVAREGSSASGIPSVNYGTLTTVPRIDGAGRVFFSSSLPVGPGGVTSANDNAIWLGTPGMLGILIREGSAAPGFPAGINFASYESVVSVNTAGQALIQATTTTSTPLGVDSTNNVGLWLGDAEALTLLARRRSQAPGFDAGVVFSNSFSNFGSRVIDSAGNIAFTGVVSGPGISLGVNDVTLFFGTSSTLTAIAKRAEAVPGGGGATFFNYLNLAPDGAGRLYYIGTFQNATSANDSAIMVYENNANAIVVREGDAAAGIDGATYGPLSNLSTNADGTVVFISDLVGLPDSENRAVYLKRRGEDPILLLREGDAIEVAPGDVRTIGSTIGWRGSNAGQASGDIGFNNAEELAVRVVFTDATDAFLLVRPGTDCPADFNGDGQADFFDYLDFVQAFSSDDPTADFNSDGQVDFFDYLDFADAFNTGC